MRRSCSTRPPSVQSAKWEKTSSEFLFAVAPAAALPTAMMLDCRGNLPVVPGAAGGDRISDCYGCGFHDRRKRL